MLYPLYLFTQFWWQLLGSIGNFSSFLNLLLALLKLYLQTPHLIAATVAPVVFLWLSLSLADWPRSSRCTVFQGKRYFSEKNKRSEKPLLVLQRRFGFPPIRFGQFTSTSFWREAQFHSQVTNASIEALTAEDGTESGTPGGGGGGGWNSTEI